MPASQDSNSEFYTTFCQYPQKKTLPLSKSGQQFETLLLFLFLSSWRETSSLCLPPFKSAHKRLGLLLLFDDRQQLLGFKWRKIYSNIPFCLGGTTIHHLVFTAQTASTIDRSEYRYDTPLPQYTFHTIHWLYCTVFSDNPTREDRNIRCQRWC